MFSRLAIAVSIALCAPVAVAEHHGEDTQVEAGVIGPVVGMAAPSFASATVVTPAISEAPLVSAQGTVLVFFRSADWCPFCKAQLKALNDTAALLAMRGWGLAAISYDDADTLRAFSDDESLRFTLLSDPDSDIIEAYGLLNTDVREGSRAWGIPHPAIVFVSADQNVSAVMREDGYRTRPSPEAILEMATVLSAPSTGPGATEE